MMRPLLPPMPPGAYTAHRLFEWCMAVMMVLIAITLAMPGDTMERAALKPIAQIGFSEANMAAFFGAVGAVRIVALYLNGHINNFRVGPKGAVIRACCAGFGCLIMAQLTTALFFDAIFIANSPSFFIPVLGTLAAGEAVSVYIAALDAKSRHTRRGRAMAALESAGL